jgi:hypothetical protein
MKKSWLPVQKQSPSAFFILPSAFLQRPMVKQDHVCPTNRIRGCDSFSGDQPSLCELRLGESLPAAP